MDTSLKGKVVQFVMPTNFNFTSMGNIVPC